MGGKYLTEPRFDSIVGKKISCGPDFYFVLSEQNKLYTWGDNTFDQLGKPISDKLDMNTIKKIACGERHTIILLDGGKLLSSGRNHYGQLGFGHCNYNKLASFQEINFPACFVKVACGQSHTIALTSNNRIYVWGCNMKGQLGLGDFKSRHAPTELFFNQVIRFKSIKCGFSHTLILTTNGQVYAFGKNKFGQLGLGHFCDTNIPTKLLFPGIKSISCGTNYSFAITASDKIYAWGLNRDSQLGLTDTVNRVIPTELKFKF